MKKSKKIISLVLAIAMVLLVPVSVISAAPKGYGFRYAGVTVYVHGKASGLIDKMGEPNKKSKSKSCAYDGEDIKYVYDEFTLVTYTEKNGGTEYVQSIKFTSKKAKTKEGIKIEYKELQQIINRTLEKLPERRLHIFRLHHTEGKKYSEIASLLSLSVKTVEKEMTRALRTLRKEIENYIQIS